jgi:anaerobic ribonucleoside-triphosphate reductase activating protein
MQLRIAQLVERTRAEGPGCRTAIWVQGCSLRCPGCCNPEMFAARGGELRNVAELAGRIAATAEIEGISVLGGEPFEQAPAVAELAARVRESGLSVVVFTGYRLAELDAIDGAADLLARIDLLFDGRYQRELPDSSRRWLGSTNQVAHFLTDRYRPDDPQLAARDTVEIRLSRDGLLVNGWPDAADRVRRS